MKNRVIKEKERKKENWEKRNWRRDCKNNRQRRERTYLLGVAATLGDALAREYLAGPPDGSYAHSLTHVAADW